MFVFCTLPVHITCMLFRYIQETIEIIMQLLEMYLRVDDIEGLSVGQYVTLNVENCQLVLYLQRLLDVTWTEGSYTSKWKTVKKKEGCTVVKWTDRVPMSSIILFDFQPTKSDQLRKAMIQQLKETYAKTDNLHT